MLARYLPILAWGRTYNRQMLVSDGVAAGIVTIMLIPQSLAYAMLAGLPPEVGLYASILPIIAYAIFGTSRTLAVGPVAVVSLMTLAAAGTVAPPGSAEFIAAALVLALLSGLILVLMGVLKLGFLANLLSHPVVSGFITASGIIIATSQLKSILGIRACPCALVLARPMAHLAAVAAAARHHIRVIEPAALEALGKVRTILFDKTGTLTMGSPAVEKVAPSPGWSARDVLEAAAAAEAGVDHPIARAILSAAGSGPAHGERLARGARGTGTGTASMWAPPRSRTASGPWCRSRSTIASPASSISPIASGRNQRLS